MIQFSTLVELPKSLVGITHQQSLLMIGSCFAENIGSRLRENAFYADINPFGILYNPLSIDEALEEIADGKIYMPNDLFSHGGLWHSKMHHSSFSCTETKETLNKINSRIAIAHDNLPKQDWLLLTFGSAFVYEDLTSHVIVGNCHKLPASRFTRRLLTVDEIVEKTGKIFDKLLHISPKLHILLTVSPIRHIADGLHANQLSKSTLLIACEQLVRQRSESVFYFPSYEIMIDELRDYRYYSDDLVHPSQLAIEYLWQRFSDTFFTEETRQINETCNALQKALRHRPLFPDSEEYKQFLKQTLLRIERFKEKYPYLASYFEQ